MKAVFLDTETNGLNPFKHKALEIAFKIVDVKTGKSLTSYESVIYQTPEEWKRSDPESLAVNGFTYEMVKEGKKGDLVAREITNLLQQNQIERGKAVFICQNPSFDRIFFSQLIDPDIQEKFKWPYYWLDFASMYWAKTLHTGKAPWETGFSKDRIASAYHLPAEERPHRAMQGVDHLILCYQNVIGFLHNLS
jgi:DNA polymerase III epsilon subunit-like protein